MSSYNMGLASFTQHPVFKVPLSLHGPVFPSVGTATHHSIVWLFHILFICSPVIADGRLACFYFWAIVKAAAVSIGGQVFVWMPLFLRVYPWEWDC